MSEQKLRLPFTLTSSLTPKGDQVRAISEITNAFKRNENIQTLLGATGTGKTFTAANVISHLGLPTLVIAHNKTLAAQLYGELKELFPHNAIEYFVSYYDYYQPEAYVPSSDTYIAKESIINDAIDRMRHSATRSLLERNDVIIVASVSCIYGLGSAEAYYDMLVFLQRGETKDRDAVIRKLVDIQYQRNEIDFHRGTFRVRGDSVEVFPAHEQDVAIRIEWFGDDIDAIHSFDPLRGKMIAPLEKIAIYPATHYAIADATRARALMSIREELAFRLQELGRDNKLVEQQRLEQRTLFDLEMLETMGYCNGVENYSRHLTGRPPGLPPPTLLDYFPKDFLLVIDESHQTIPQLMGMYRGDRARKTTLVEHGFRLPSALDNRPLQFAEFERFINKVLFISATPAAYELEQSAGVVVEQIIRPTGLLDPTVIVRPIKNQVDDLLSESQKRIQERERILVTTLTKRMAEDLSEFYADAGVKVRYLHSEIDTLARIEIIRDLRLGVFDVLVGVNLLREGLDLPEVSLVGILDADKEGFLRSERSLIQTIGRAARNVRGTVIMYADKITDSMKKALDETNRRREIQHVYNQEHGIIPQTVKKAISAVGPQRDNELPKEEPRSNEFMDPTELPKLIEELRAQMLVHAEKLEFEKAAALRDRLQELEHFARTT